MGGAEDTPHTAQRHPSSALLACSCMLLLPSLAVFLCRPHVGGTRLRLQGQGKGTVIQLGTAMLSNPRFPPGSSWSCTVQACPASPGWSTPPSPSEKAKVVFPRFRGQVTSDCLPMPNLSAGLSQVPESLPGQKQCASTSLKPVLKRKATGLN